MLHNSLIADQLDWCSNRPLTETLHCKAKTRYRQEDQDCVVTPLENRQIEVIFSQPQRAITEGQSVVFYQGEVCLGGGIIESKANL
jgi:tRNA-specific 2-thiouridylase